jgi:hypothetical protein
MPKINWAASDEDGALTAEDIDNAEDGFAQYAGDIPPGGVYRFKVRRIRFKQASTGTQGLNNLLVLDGSWKPAHAKFDGCPMWDTVWITKGSAAFVKAFAAALGVSSRDILTKVIADEDGYVTKIGTKAIKEGMQLYVAVRKETYEDSPRLAIAGTGYQVVDATIVEDSDEPEAEKPAAKKPAKAAAGKAGKKNKAKAEDDEPPF